MEDSVHRSPPSEEEKHGYFRGLPSRPILIARTSTDPWVMYENFHCVYKTLSVVRKHAVIDMWDSGPLYRDIIECLENVEMIGVDILRLGYEHLSKLDEDQESDKPVTMLISVKKDSIDPSNGLAIVLRCQGILRTYGLEDVEVEMKEAVLSLP